MNWRFESQAAKLPTEGFPIRREHAEQLRAGGHAKAVAEREALIDEACDDFGRLAREWQSRIVAKDDELTATLRQLEADQIERARTAA